jgi:Flp pilus assembly protein TadD
MTMARKKSSDKKSDREKTDTAASVNEQAKQLFDKGDYDGAEPLFRRALAIREKVLGPEDPNTGNSLYLLAKLLDIKGDTDGAETALPSGAGDP